MTRYTHSDRSMLDGHHSSGPTIASGVLPFHKYFTKSIPLRIPDGGNFCIDTQGLRYSTRRGGLKPYSELTDTTPWPSQPACRESSCKMGLYFAG